MTEKEIGEAFSKAVGEIHSLFPMLSKKELYQMMGDFFHQKAEVKVYTLARLKEMAEEYIGEAEHDGSNDSATWQECIRDFVLAVEHWD